jgi:diguanylate cyclase (GGDEF)-like protein/PAS domain S-box-containing protein
MLLRSIRFRLLALVLAGFTPFVALGGVDLWSEWQDSQAAAIEQARNEARVLAAQVDDHVGNLEHLLAGLSRAVSTNPAATDENDALLRDIAAELPGFINHVGLFALDGSNIGLTRDVEGGARPNISDRPYFQKIVSGERLTVGDPLVGRASGQWVINIARGVEDLTGRLRAVLVIGTQLDHFQNALRIHGLPPGSVVRVLDENGIVIAQNVDGPNWIGRNVGHSEDVARYLTAAEGSEIIAWPDGTKRLTGFSTTHRAPWVVSVGLPMNLASAALVSRLGWVALLSAAALAAAFAIVWIYSGRVVRPLQQLEKDAAALASGALNHRSEVRTGDEVERLADAFNRMAASLERRRDEMQQARDTLSAVIDASPVAISCSDLHRRIVLWNRAAERLYGYTAEEAVGALIKVVPPGWGAGSHRLFERARKGETVRDQQVKRKRKDGSIVDVSLAAAPIYNSDGTVRGVAWAVEDITDRKRAEEQLKRLAHYDPLTGLPNRLSLQNELEVLLTGDVAQRPTSIALFDLDGFKEVNDTLGHSIGDRLLVAVGRRLTEVAQSCSKTCQVFRLGGDEFVAAVRDCGDPRVVGDIVETMLGRLAEPFEINEQVLHLGASAGVAIAPADGVNVDELIANADLALYQAKSDGRRTCRFFLPVMRAKAQARRSLDLELRRAFTANEFEIYFQPQVRLVDGAVISAEALLRWRHPQRGILAPGAFIETLAESPIATDVGRWILRTACERVSSWRAAGLPLDGIAVNLFPSQLRDDALLKDVDDALAASGLPSRALELEITENVALDHEAAIAPLQALREKGVRIAFDDFGTGYASLSNLTRYPLTRIKIDRSFVRKIGDNAQGAAIVRSLIAMAHSVGLAVIAEGVETDAEAAFLLAETCEEAQGFLYAKPLSVSEFEAHLRAGRFGVRSADHCPIPGGPVQRRVGRSSSRRN